MQPSEPVRIALVVLVFAVAGAVFLSSASGYGRTLGWSLLLLFGGGGAAYVALEGLRRRHGLWGSRLAQVPGEAGAEPGFVFRFRAAGSRARANGRGRSPTRWCTASR